VSHAEEFWNPANINPLGCFFFRHLFYLIFEIHSG
jgi:hypothetical protein